MPIGRVPESNAAARAIFDAAVGAVQADRLLDSFRWESIGNRPLGGYRRIFVVGMGKAALAMASVVEGRLPVTGGCVVVPEGYVATLPGRLRPPTAVDVMEGGHPVPNETSRSAARRILEIAGGAREDDLVLVLISGGGSALCADFASGISLEDARRTYGLLIESGADIHAINSVRKHISRVGGGRVALAAQPAEVVSCIVSDVVGDDLSVIAGGPTAGDESTFHDVQEVLETYHLWEELPTSVREVVMRGLADPSFETVKPGSPVLERATNRLVGTNETALSAALDEAEALGFKARIVTRTLSGEAREVGRALAEGLTSLDGTSCLLFGGETTVTVRGNGRGGRNQELALASGIALESATNDAVLLSAGTDGIDGPTGAAGAIVTPATIPIARRRDLDPEAFLENNDSHSFFSQAGSLIITGPTHTNVMDVVVGLSCPFLKGTS